MSTAPRSRIPWHTIVIGLATVGLLWLFFRNIDLAETWVAMTHAHVGYLAGAVVATNNVFKRFGYLGESWVFVVDEDTGGLSIRQDCREWLDQFMREAAGKLAQHRYAHQMGNLGSS